MTDSRRAGIEGPAELPADPTGVRGLDAVLGGGLPRRALMLVTGSPGSGKTTLSAQIAVAAVRAGRRALIATVLAESTDKLVAHMRTYRFFDAELLGDGLQILSLGQFLEVGMVRVGEELIGLIRDHHAQLVVLDGFDGLRDADPDSRSARHLLYNVGNSAAAMGATTIVTSVSDLREGPLATRATAADAIVHLGHGLVGMRERRRMEVVKVRGAAPLAGLHALTLDADGVTIYPRLESRVASARRNSVMVDQRGEVSSAQDAPTEKGRITNSVAAFGVPALDALLAGGRAGTPTLLTGGVGTGKTLLGLRFALTGIAHGEAAVMLNFRENRHELQSMASAFALGRTMARALETGGGLTLLDVDVPPVELDADVLAGNLLDILDKTGARRLVVDSSADLERAVVVSDSVDRVADYLGALVVALRAREISALFIKEVLRGQPDASAEDGLAPRVDNVVLLQQEVRDGQLRRELLIVKMRFAAHNVRRYPYTIEAPAGIVLGATEDPLENQS